MRESISVFVMHSYKKYWVYMERMPVLMIHGICYKSFSHCGILTNTSQTSIRSTQETSSSQPD